jgi:hypothetical protein
VQGGKARPHEAEIAVIPRFRHPWTLALASILLAGCAASEEPRPRQEWPVELPQYILPLGASPCDAIRSEIWINLHRIEMLWTSARSMAVVRSRWYQQELDARAAAGSPS